MVVGYPMDGSQFDTAVRESGRPSGHDDMPCALRAAKMVEPSLIRAGTCRPWKRLSA